MLILLCFVFPGLRKLSFLLKAFSNLVINIYELKWNIYFFSLISPKFRNSWYSFHCNKFHYLNKFNKNLFSLYQNTTGNTGYITKALNRMSYLREMCIDPDMTRQLGKIDLVPYFICLPSALPYEYGRLHFLARPATLKKAVHSDCRYCKENLVMILRLAS